MSAIWVLAQLTLREALRRKLVAAGAAVSVALIGLSAWGFWKLSHNHTMTSGEVQIAIPQAFVLFMFMFSFVVALSASAIASPAISSEIDSGVLQHLAAPHGPGGHGLQDAGVDLAGDRRGGDG